MSNQFDILEVDDVVCRAFDEGPTDRGFLFRMTLPRQQELDGGWDSLGVDLANTFHNLKYDTGVFSSKNNSELNGLEIWYENEEIKFFYFVESEEQNKHYRRQLAGRFDGIELDDVLERKDRFVNVKEGEFVGAVRLGLAHHYFEPIAQPKDGNDGGTAADPYQTILSEIDTKDNTRTVVQFLYRPAPPDWTKLFGMSANSYADRVQEGEKNIRFFGLSSSRISTESRQAAVAEKIREQAGKPAYHVDIRIAVIADSQADVQSQLDEITNLYSSIYRTDLGQQFVPYGQTEDTVYDMLKRESDRLDKPSGVLGYFSFNMSNICKYITLTMPEFSHVIHVPLGNSVSVDGIQWTKSIVTGTLPPNAPKFEAVREEERQKWEDANRCLLDTVEVYP